MTNRFVSSAYSSNLASWMFNDRSCVQELWLYCWQQQTGQVWSGGETLLCGEATMCSGIVAVLLTAANRTGVERWWNIVVWRGNNVFRNCGCTADSSKQDRCGAVVKHSCVERQQCVQELWLYCWQQQAGQVWSGGETLLFGEATMCSGTVGVLLTVAGRTGVERWWNIVVWTGNNVFRNCGCTADGSRQDRCGAVVKHCCVERQQCVHCELLT